MERFTKWKSTNGDHVFRSIYRIVSIVVCLCLVAVFFVTVSWLPPFGNPENPTNNEVPAKYIQEGLQDTGATNVVAGMILDYRAFDTFAEACVLFVAVCAVVTLLKRDGAHDVFDAFLQSLESTRENVILQTTALLLVPMIFIFGCYVAINGHLSPGGGFSGGSIMGAALILFTYAYGTKRAQRFINFKTYSIVVSTSLLFYAFAKGYSFFTGANHIDSAIPLGTPGRLLSSGLILPLNIAVGLIVTCTVYVICILFTQGDLE